MVANLPIRSASFLIISAFGKAVAQLIQIEIFDVLVEALAAVDDAARQDLDNTVGRVFDSLQEGGSVFARCNGQRRVISTVIVCSNKICIILFTFG
jgi:hypothetical protein